MKLRDAWVDYAALLADPGADNTEYPTIKASIDALVNESVFQSELVADARIGKPMGTATGGTPQPDLQESPKAGTSIDDMTQTLTGIRNIYFGSRDGTPGKGIEADFAEDSRAGLERVLAVIEPGDVVLVKASRGIRAELVVAGLIEAKGHKA